MTSTSWNCARNRRQEGTGFSAVGSLGPNRGRRDWASSTVRPNRLSVSSAARTSLTLWRYAVPESGASPDPLGTCLFLGAVTPYTPMLLTNYMTEWHAIL